MATWTNAAAVTDTELLAADDLAVRDGCLVESPKCPVDTAHRWVLRQLGWGRLVRKLPGLWEADRPSWPLADLPAVCETVVRTLRDGFGADPDDRIEVWLFGADMEADEPEPETDLNLEELGEL